MPKTSAHHERLGIGAEDFRLLMRSPLFTALAPERLEALIGESRVRMLDRGEVLFLQDDPADAFFFMLDGWIKICRITPHGDESIIGVFTRGESFAEAAIFQEGTFPVTAQAVEVTRVLSIAARPFIERLRRDPELCLSVMAAMSRHFRTLVTQLEQLTTKSSVQRLGEFLLRLSHRESGSAEIRLPMDKSLIAGRLGMQPETLSRSLSKLRSAGVITDHDRIAIENVETLRSFVQG